MLVFITARKQCLGQGYIFTGVCHSVNGRSVRETPRETTPPPGRTPPTRETPLPRRPPPGRPGRPPMPGKPPCQGDPPPGQQPSVQAHSQGETEGDQVQAHSQWGNWGGSDPGPHPRGKLRGIRCRPTPKGEIQGNQAQTPPPPTMTTAVGGTHPTGMHSCIFLHFLHLHLQTRMILVIVCLIVWKLCGSIGFFTNTQNCQ